MNQPPDCLLFEFPKKVWLLYDFGHQKYGACIWREGSEETNEDQPMLCLFAFSTAEEADQMAAIFTGMTMIPVEVSFDDARDVVKTGLDANLHAIALWQPQGDPIIHHCR